MRSLRRTFIIFWKSVIIFIRSLIRFFSKLFFLDLWRNSSARPVLIYAVVIVLAGMFIFHWLEKWDYLDSLYFVVITLTTIGFGDFSPTTTLSKTITIFYGLNGIVILLVLFDLIRQVRKTELKSKAKKLEDSQGSAAKTIVNNPQQNLQTTPAEPPDQKPIRKKKSAAAILKDTVTKLFLIDLIRDKQSRNVLIFAGVVIAMGGFALYRVEQWSLFNSIYFMFTTMTTIGYGDLTPDHDWGKVLTIFFGLNGIVVLLSLYDRIRAVRGDEHLSE